MNKILGFLNKKGQDNKTKSSVRCEVAEAIERAMGLTADVVMTARNLQDELKHLEKIRIKKCSSQTS